MFLSLLLVLGFALIFTSSRGDQHLAIQESDNLLAIPGTSNRVQPLAARPLNSPFSAQGQFRPMPNVKVHGLPEQTTQRENADQAEMSHTRRAAILSSVLSLGSLAAPRADAVTACNPGANNCWSTTSTDKTKMAPWTWPEAMSREKAISELKATLESYPQQGQDGVDLGGWSVADDQLADKGYMRLEYKSGIGNFAKFFNGGKPFVDDLEVSVEPKLVAIRSSSRVGDSDFGVNAKRLNYLSAALREKGWDAPAIST